MQIISNSVGKGGTSQKHDVSLVQVILKCVKNAKGQPYAAFGYDGVCSAGGATRNAIESFQSVILIL